MTAGTSDQEQAQVGSRYQPLIDNEPTMPRRNSAALAASLRDEPVEWGSRSATGSSIPAIRLRDDGSLYIATPAREAFNIPVYLKGMTARVGLQSYNSVLVIELREGDERGFWKVSVDGTITNSLNLPEKGWQPGWYEMHRDDETGRLIVLRDDRLADWQVVSRKPRRRNTSTEPRVPSAAGKG